MTAKSQIKVLMALENMNAKELANLLVEKTGQKFTQNSILQKISKSSFRYDEIELIAKTLGYIIEFKKE
jgi:hypothetical protein